MQTVIKLFRKNRAFAAQVPFVAPKLTFPDAEAAWVKEHYSSAKVILEYGSGGSTVLAGEQADTTVFAVESDLTWAKNLETWFKDNKPTAHVEIHGVDVGATKAWGYPVSDLGWRKYHRYPMSVWDRPDFQDPDLVLIDGRFRAACFMTVMLRTKRPVTVLFDDYVERDTYHVVERYAKPSEIRGRMARFDLTPRSFPSEDMTLIFETFTCEQ